MTEKLYYENVSDTAIITIHHTGTNMKPGKPPTRHHKALKCLTLES